MQDFKLHSLRPLLNTFAEALSGVDYFMGPCQIVDLVIDWKSPGTASVFQTHFFFARGAVLFNIKLFSVVELSVLCRLASGNDASSRLG